MNRFLPFLLTCLIFWTALPGQSWIFDQPLYPTGPQSNWGGFTSIHEVPGSGYMLSGYTNPGVFSPLLTRIDDDANLIWSAFDANGQINGVNGYITDLQPTPDGGFIGFSNTNGNGIRARKIDANGNDIWSHSFSTSSTVTPFFYYKLAYSLDQSSAGDVLAVISDPSGPPKLTKLTALGAVTYSNTYTSMPNLGPRIQCQLSPGGGAFISGIDQGQPFLARISPTGSINWSRSYNAPLGMSTQLVSTQVGADTSLTVLWGSNQYFNGLFILNLVKYAPNGDTLWDYQIPQFSSYPHSYADVFQDSLGILLLYNTDSLGPSKVVELNHQGIALDSFSVDTFPSDPWMFGELRTRYSRIIRDSQERILLAGDIFNAYNSHPIAIRLDSLNQFDVNSVSGVIYQDDNQDCIPQVTETHMGQWLVLANGNPLAITDASGSYTRDLGNTSMTLTALPLSSQWANLWDVTCPASGSHTVTFTSGQDDIITGLDFGAEPLISCPLLWVDLSAPFLRACLPNTYHINYCNYGTTTGDSAYIIVNLDSSLTFLSSPQPYTLVSGAHEIRFDLGAVAPNECGSFTFEAEVACDTANPGRIHCATANIYPDSNCAPLNPNWSGASLEVNAECLLNDSVRFTITNSGTANMVNASGVWVVEDDILRFSNAVELNVGEDSVFTIKGNGSTWATLVDQVPFHPGPSLPRAIYEGCGFNISGGISLGYASQFADDDMPPNISIDCQPDIAAYDPNDKVPFPTGVGSNHEIFASDELEYLIRFQNTGNDTAFKVIIRDHIPSTLDMTTFIMAGSSHPYTLDILNGTTLEWTFDPIALPDSGTNFVESQGFVKFNIRQQPGNTPGTLIENAAEIFFDFNPPVITDTAWHTIAGPYQMQILTHQEDPLHPLHILAYPNPFSESISFQLTDDNRQDLRFELYDLSGKLVQIRELHEVNQFKVDRGGLPDGIYLYRLKGSAGASAEGKLMIQTN